MEPLAAQRKHRIIWFSTMLAVLLMGLAQRDKRALWETVDTPAAVASAFAAIAPQSPGMIFGTPGQTGTGSATARHGHSGSGTAGAAADPAGRTGNSAGGAPSIFDQPSDGSTGAPSALLALADQPGSGGAGITNYGPGIGNVGATSSPGGPVAVQDAVPEAPTWIIMILGIAGIGGLARYRRSRGLPILPPAAHG